MGHVKLCDFGLGRDLRLADPSRPATGGVGTARYMAPEVVMRRPYGTAVDVYSYGMLLWEMAARREPFAGEPARKAAIEAACVDRRPAVPRSTPPRLAALIRACWAPSAGDRPTAPQIVHFIESAPVVPREMRACRVPMSDASCALGETDNDGWLAWTETESECVTVSDSLSHHTSASPTAACSRVSCTSNTSSDALDTDAGGVSTAVRFSS